MGSIGQDFRAWVMRQRPRGITPVSERHGSHDRYSIDAGPAVAQVDIWPYKDELEIAEYQIVRASEPDPVFFLHVLLDDLDRAEELFGEMVDALDDVVAHATTQVLLCCTSALTTSLFAHKMDEAAKTLSLDYDFTAMSVDRVLHATDSYDAILLAPQVRHLRKDIATAHPNALVFEIPAKTYGSYDALGALRLLMHALRDASLPDERRTDTTRVARDLSNDYRILIITLFTLRDSSRLGYRLYDHGTAIAEGAVRKPRLDYRDIEDLLETLDGRGVPIEALDMVGVAVPGVAYHGVVSLPNAVKGDYDLGRHIRERFGFRTSVDNNCNAAAVGCYVGQDRYESVMFYRHELGHVAGGLGTVIDGTLLKGRHNLAGEPKYYESLFHYDPSYDEMIWSEDGMFQIARNVTLSHIALISPEAIYLSVDTVDDMEKLRDALASDIPILDDRCILAGPQGTPLLGLPDELIPDLYVVDDYVERVYLGEMALCLQKLRNPDYRSLGIA